MSTKYKYSAAAKRRRQRMLMRRRITCLVVSTGIITSSTYAFNQYHTKVYKLFNVTLTSRKLHKQTIVAASRRSVKQSKLITTTLIKN